MRLRLAAFAIPIVVLSAGSAGAVTPAGTELRASASITYVDPRGATIAVGSNTLATTVAAVGAIVVAPKENAPDPGTEGFTAGTNVVRTFTLQNTSNVVDSYAVTSVDLSAGTLASLVFVAGGVETPVGVGSGTSPKIAPGETIALRATVQTAGATIGTVVSLLVRVRTSAVGTANGPQADWGRSYAVVASAPKLSGIAGPSAPIDKTVDGARTARRSPGATVHYAIAFANTGGAAATNVVVDDALPTGVRVDPASVTLNGAAVSGAVLARGHLVLALPSLAVAAHAVVAFDAAVERAVPLGTTLVNTATVAADGLRAVATLPATVFIGSAGIVFDGLGASGVPVNGAIVTLSDALTNLPAALPAAGPIPNPANANPFTVAADGSYGFTLPAVPGVGGDGGFAYVLAVRAPAGYQNRRIRVSYTPDASGVLGALSATALDGEPLAAEGGFGLVNRPVVFHDVAGVFPNLPLFPLRAFAVALSADRAFASAGDRIIYTATVRNAQAQHVAAARITVVLPPGIALAPGSARLDDVAREPVRTERGSLVWPVAEPDAAVHTLRFAAVVLPSTASGQTFSVTATVHAPAELSALDTTATTDVRIVAGILSERGIVTGRVYANAANRRLGVAGARVYREDGSSVVTDAAGRFSFLGMRPGMHVLRLDTESLPPGLRAFDAPGYARNRSTTRLIHGVLDSGNLDDVEFEVQQR